MALGVEVGLGPGHIVLDVDPAALPIWYGGRPSRRPTRHCIRWDPAAPPLKGHSPSQCLANVRCGQTAGWTKMPLGMEVGLGTGDFVFDGDPATPGKRAHPPHPSFGLCLLWPNGWMDEDATCE